MNRLVFQLTVLLLAASLVAGCGAARLASHADDVGRVASVADDAARAASVTDDAARAAAHADDAGVPRPVPEAGALDEGVRRADAEGLKLVLETGSEAAQAVVDSADLEDWLESSTESLAAGPAAGEGAPDEVRAAFVKAAEGLTALSPVQAVPGREGWYAQWFEDGEGRLLGLYDPGTRQVALARETD